MRTYAGKMYEYAIDSILNEHTADDFFAMDQLHADFYDYALERIWRWLNENDKD